MPLYGQIEILINLNRLYVVSADFVGAGRSYTKIIACVFMFMFVHVSAHAKSAHSDNVDQREYNIRTAYLFNLLRFLSWHKDSPHSASTKINLCTSASDLEYETLKKLETKQVNGKAISVVRLSEKQYKKSPSACHIAYLVPKKKLTTKNKKLKHAASKKVRKAIIQHHGYKVVTVGNGEHFIEQGGIVAIVLSNNRMRLNINYKKAKEIGVHMSANLLEVAHIVH